MYSPSIWLHIIAGLTALLGGFTALLVRKGSRLHRRAGNVFVVAMIAMAGSGAAMAIQRFEPLNIIAGSLTCYLVATAWLTVMRRPRETGRGEIALLVLGVIVGAAAFMLARQTANHAEAVTCYMFGSVALLSSAGDLRMLLRGGFAGGQRLARHIWRICTALFIATASFFIGTAGDPQFRRTGLRARLFTPEVRATHINLVPVFLVIGLMIFWLIRVRIAKQYRGAAA